MPSCRSHQKVSSVAQSAHVGHQRRRLPIHRATPETEEARSPLDAPQVMPSLQPYPMHSLSTPDTQEWEAPAPSKRPDIFPEFDKMDKVFLPKPLPGDPEMPDEELEETSKRTVPGDPDPEQKPGEAPELPEKPVEPGSPEEKEKQTDIPSMPE